ncbi:MAG: hypothetical protein V2I82_10480 [Halieaceae bacterium]|nr:hypothetical protein [Halieaceae bacterium]
MAPPLPAIPDGATAPYETMLAGQRAIKAFQAQNMQYMHCLEARFGRLDRADKAAATAEDRAQAEDAYHAAVSAEEEVVASFNIELREYRARQRD